MTQSQPNQLSMGRILILGGLLVTLSMGIRHGFGLFNLPITTANGWGRETFAFAIALQNLMWGVSQPFTGALADRFGSFRVMFAGAFLYIFGLIIMATTTSGFSFTIGAGLLIGLAQSASTYSIVYGLIGRNVSPEKRVWAMGVAAAAGSFGQFLMIPVEQGLISELGPNDALLILALLATFLIPLAIGLKEPKSSNLSQSNQTISEALKEAFSTRSFQLLTLGYFVCGFQVVFIGVHLAPYLKDMSATIPSVGNPQVATIALALIGLFNVFGTYYAGVLGQRFAKRYLLSTIYVSRSIVIIGFLLIPLSPITTYLFAALMGLLWLSTVPLTNGIVAQIFGVKYLSMLSGVDFFSHQIGSFMGAYLGGYLYDKTGSYNVVWMIAIALGAFAGLVNLPIKEQSVLRTQTA